MPKGKGQKRERSVNFTSEESERPSLQREKNIVECKENGATTWDEKDKAWLAIEKAFNSFVGGVFREAKNLREKYVSLKRDLRKKCATLRAEMYKTGTVNVPPLTPLEEKIKSMILLSVEGGESVYDSDKTHTGSMEITPSALVRDEESSRFFPLEGEEENVNASAQDEDAPPEGEADIQPCSSRQVILQENYASQSKWKSWNPASLRKRKHPALCKPKEKRPFEKLVETKLEVANTQKKLAEDEIQHKIEMHELEKKNKIEMHEIEKKKKMEMRELEKEYLSIRIELAKAELRKVQEKNSL